MNKLEEGCDYCTEQVPYRDCVLPDGTERILLSIGKPLGYGYINERIINFCPFCGRKITENGKRGREK